MAHVTAIAIACCRFIIVAREPSGAARPGTSVPDLPLASVSGIPVLFFRIIQILFNRKELWFVGGVGDLLLIQIYIFLYAPKVPQYHFV